jgi:hypothetical protein
MLVRSVVLGDQVVVAGSVHFELDGSGQVGPDAPAWGSYREAPAIAVIDACALFDAPAWAQATAWHALPWYRKLSVIIRNR